MNGMPQKRKQTILDFFNKKPKVEAEDSFEMSGNSQPCTSTSSFHHQVQTIPGTESETQTNIFPVQSPVRQSSTLEDTIYCADKGCHSQNNCSEIQATQSSSVDNHDGWSSDSSSFDPEHYLDIPSHKPGASMEGKFQGTPLEELQKMQDQTENNLWREGHILFDYNSLKNDGAPGPYPKEYTDAYDKHHVRLPCSPESSYPVNKYETKRKWELIEEALGEKSNNPGIYELVENMLSYNSRYNEKWKFEVLYHYFEETLEKEKVRNFFNKILPKMMKLALRLPELCTMPIPLLKKNKKDSISLSQLQIACLLANAFFCTFPMRNTQKHFSEYASYPSINFNSLFCGSDNIAVKEEKLKCIFNYFERVTEEEPTGIVTFTRQSYVPEDWTTEKAYIKKLHVSAQGTIEDDGKDFLQVDFANKFIGGGVLGNGCVQEEIRFLICPEMIVSRLFTEELQDNECLIMKGCERYSKYTGYGKTFKFDGNYEDTTKRDRYKRRYTEVVAIDAVVMHSYKHQFKKHVVMRELNKAYIGFVAPQCQDPKKLAAVCTGNWGCGAFGGDKCLKALLQLMAASRAGRDLCYFTFGDEDLVMSLHLMHLQLTQNESLTYGKILQWIQKYHEYLVKFHGYYNYERKNLFQFIYGEIQETVKNTPKYSSEAALSKAGQQSPNYRANTP